MFKVCTKCLKNLSIDLFGKNKRRKDGKENKCLECYRKERQEPAYREVQLKSQENWRNKNKDYQANWRKDNEKHKEYQKRYYEENKEKYIERKREFRKNNPQRETEIRRNYVEKNRDKVNEYSRKWKAKQKQNDVSYKLRENISRRIRYELSSNKEKSTCEYLGCTIKYLKIYLEAKFSSWMNWENYGKIWHIDHIIPCKAWDLSKEFDNYCCWNYRNLQPLYATSNIIKKDKYDPIKKELYVYKMKTILV